MCASLREKFPTVVHLLVDAEEEILTFYDLPDEHRRQIYSTNSFERLNKELKRRSAVVGIFSNLEAVIRLHGALVAEQNDECLVGQRCFREASMAKLLRPSTAAEQLQPGGDRRLKQHHRAESARDFPPRDGTRPPSGPRRGGRHRRGADQGSRTPHVNLHMGRMRTLRDFLHEEFDVDVDVDAYEGMVDYVKTWPLGKPQGIVNWFQFNDAVHSLRRTCPWIKHRTQDQLGPPPGWKPPRARLL